MTARTERQVTRVRNAIVGSILVLIAVVLAIGIYYSTGSKPGEFTAGEHYLVLEETQRRRAGEPIKVQEFFSYGCVHCRNFDPMLDDWKKTVAPDVVFERVPATFSPAWMVLAQTYYALEELGALERNHQRVFRAIHDTGRQFVSIEAMADFIAGGGMTRDAFLAAANGPGVRGKLREAERAQRTLLISGVPTLIVANRYLVGMNVGRKTALEIVEHLIELERAEIPTAQRASSGD